MTGHTSDSNTVASSAPAPRPAPRALLHIPGDVVATRLRLDATKLVVATQAELRVHVFAFRGREDGLTGQVRRSKVEMWKLLS